MVPSQLFQAYGSEIETDLNYRFSKYFTAHKRKSTPTVVASKHNGSTNSVFRIFQWKLSSYMYLIREINRKTEE